MMQKEKDIYIPFIDVIETELKSALKGMSAREIRLGAMRICNSTSDILRLSRLNLVHMSVQVLEKAIELEKPSVHDKKKEWDERETSLFFTEHMRVVLQLLRERENQLEEEIRLIGEEWADRI